MILDRRLLSEMPVATMIFANSATRLKKSLTEGGSILKGLLVSVALYYEDVCPACPNDVYS